MEMDGPIHVVRNAFFYDVGLYRCIPSRGDSAKSRAWEIAERVPGSQHAAQGVHVLSKIRVTKKPQRPRLKSCSQP